LYSINRHLYYIKVAKTPSRKLISRIKKEDHMVQATPALYFVQSGDSLFKIAQDFYGDGNKWHQIYDYCNRQVIGPNPDHILPGEALYIPAMTGAPVVKTCTVTVSHLNARAAPNTQSAPLGAGFPQDTVLTFFEVVNGENVQGNPRWGHSEQHYYFWLGGTDHPNG
jgi:hypothetical protein